MDRIEDPVQTHIWMEAWPSCERVFLDAGELTDLKYETFSDKIKSPLKDKRKHTGARAIPRVVGSRLLPPGLRP